MLRRVGARSLQNGVEPGADSGGGGLHGSAADLRNGNSKGERMGAVTISRAASSQLPVTRFQMPAYSYSYSARRAVLVLDPHSHPEDIALRSSARVRVPSSVVPSEGSRGSSIPDLCRVASRLLPIVLVLSPEGGTRTRSMHLFHRLVGTLAPPLATHGSPGKVPAKIFEARFGQIR